MSRQTGKTKQLGSLLEIIRTVNSTLDLDEVLQAILRFTLDSLQGEAGSIMLISEEELTIAASAGLPKEIVERTRMRVGEGIAGWVAKTGQTLLLDGKVRKGPFINLVDRKDTISSSLCAPLNAKGTIIGVLMVRRTTALRFTQQQQEFFRSIADQVSIAIAHARLYEAERKRSEELASANRSLAFEKGKLEAVLSGMADGVLVTDAGGKVMLINTVASMIFDEQCRSSDVLLFDDLFSTPRFEEVRASFVDENLAYSWEYSPPEGKDIVFKVLASPIFDEMPGLNSCEEPADASSGDSPRGNIYGIVFVLRNVSDEKRLDRMKTQFLSMVSHELKTPLTSIQGFVELLLFKEYPEARRRQFLTISLEECHRLMRLFDNLLTLSRLEAGQFQFHKETISLDTLSGYLVENFKAQHLNHQFTVTVEDKPYRVHADGDMIAQVITNLLSNAVKYSPKGGTIRVVVRNQGAEVAVSVADEGVGIAQDKLPYVFEKFFRVDSTLTRETGGAGLGLANARYIVEAHDGSLFVESRPGEGSVFTFTIPALFDDMNK